MVYRLYVEKKEAFAQEAAALKKDLIGFLGIESLQDLRMFNRYDVEDLDADVLERCKNIVFAEPQVDRVTTELPADANAVFAVEYLPGQFDQRADSCAQCIQFVAGGERPVVKSAKVYALYGNLSAEDVEAVKKYVINPVESREASQELPETLKTVYPTPDDVMILEGFIDLDQAGLADMIKDFGLAMDQADITFAQEYFRGEKRNPSLTELRMIDTYWSDHCRHTTFGTNLENIQISDPRVEAGYNRYVDLRKELGREHKPMCLMDIATIGAKYLKHTGTLTTMDESEEINACTVKVKVDVDGEEQDWLFLFKNETHNHPTEIEPFGGAATCLGGAIRDPLSGRGYVYQAMRVTGAADPTVSLAETMEGKLPQRKLVTTAAAGYSSYGNQIGLATGLVDELYHPGYAAKRMEIGAVVGAAPASHVRREVPAPGDIIVLLGGRTGRDGVGGATGSSKSHKLSSLEECGAEVQKGNPPEERKLQRLFRKEEASSMIKRCNDFGAGGVSVAIGELAAGLSIHLDRVPKKYEGLDGTELAISESQERMAVVLDPKDVARFLELAHEENLEATPVAEVQAEPRLTMDWRGKRIVDLSRAFLDSNGAPKKTEVNALKGGIYKREFPGSTLKEKLVNLAGDLNICSKRGLSERFDSTIGSGTVLMPFGGKNQRTPAQAMAAKISVENGLTDTCSIMGYGYNPYLASENQYVGAYLAVVESVSKVIAAGGTMKNCWLTLQEYFEKLGTNPSKWGKPFSSLLGALDAQLDLGVGAIGGKDSMSGSFEQLNVPPTLVSFAVSVSKADLVVSPEFKKAGSRVALITPDYAEDGIPSKEGLLAVLARIEKLIAEKKALSVWALSTGGVAEGILKMAMGNGIGFAFANDILPDDIFSNKYGSFIVELKDEDAAITAAARTPEEAWNCKMLGVTTEAYEIAFRCESVAMADIEEAYENKLESVFPCNIPAAKGEAPEIVWTERNLHKPAPVIARPRVLLPVFPGTNCEYDTARVFERAGAEPIITVINNLSAEGIAQSVEKIAKQIRESQIVFLPGGFSGGDEPDGSGKFINAFFREASLTDAIHDLLQNRDGLMAGICNGFQALIKLGLVPYGRITEPSEDAPTLTFNVIGRHQSKLVQTRVASVKSPWLAGCEVGDIHTVAVSHGEGRFLCPEGFLKELADNGQLATQYVDLSGKPSMDVQFNPNGSIWAVEGITSPDGRVFGKMCHSERYENNLYKNVPGEKDNRMFESAVRYFK
ncbi:MAG: phosphoribosylformylglycinamidine synthase [Clostridiales bacterium]|nr:phosphoribosylformylglycinamidine synthase [Clostridiales bacterium]